MKQVAGPLRIDLAQYREVASFAQLTSDLDSATLFQLRRGARLAEVLKQKPHCPSRPEHEVCVLWAAVNGHLDIVPLADLERYLSEWLTFLEDAYTEALDALRASHELTEPVAARLADAVRAFAGVFVPTAEAESEAPAVIGISDQEKEPHIAGAATASTA
jgi:F-type H+-transporting ATPase subunit alpha